MLRNNSIILFFIIIFCILVNIHSLRSKDRDTCPNKFNDFLLKDSKAQVKNMLKYYQKNKTIEYELDELTLKMSFIGIAQYESAEPSSDFRVNYTINFYDKEKLGIDEIRALIDFEIPLYNYRVEKKGTETKGEINWEVKVQENNNKKQIVQLVAEASFEGNKEIYVYNSFVFSYNKEEEDTTDKKQEIFWIIFFSFIGAIIITFGVMYVYFYATIEIGRDTLKLSNIDPEIEQRVSNEDKNLKRYESRTTA